MSVRFRPLQEKDYIRNTSSGSDFAGDPYKWLNSQTMSTSSDECFSNSVNDFVRKYIRLAAPTFNCVLAGSSCKLLWSILGVPSDDGARIRSFKLVYDEFDDKLVKVNDIQEEGSYLYGAQIAEKYIQELDLKERLYNHILETITSTLCKATVLMDFNFALECIKNVTDLNTEGRGTRLAAEYYVSFDTESVSHISRKGTPITYWGSCVQTKYAADVDAAVDDVRNVLLKNSDSLFTIMYNMLQSDDPKESLRAMLNHYIMVLPYGMRPMIDGRQHAITKLYAPILTANNELEGVIGAAPPKAVIPRYQELENAVQALQAGFTDKNRPLKYKDTISIMDMLKSKHGQVRAKNLGKRQDYSGRAVVCINPYLAFDHIKIPKSMAPKLFEHHILPYLAEEQNKEYLLSLREPTTRAKMIEIIEDKGILFRVPVMMGRQPTLHKQSLLSFYVELTDMNAIEVSPLICEGYNMDFDGDQAHLEVPLSDEAVDEVRNLTLASQNLFYAKDGSSIAKPRMDMLYGLYLCTKNDNTLGTPIHSYASPESARQAVLAHKVAPWDTVSIPSYGAITAGDAAFIACFAEGDVVPRGHTPGPGQIEVQQVDKKSAGKLMEHILRVDENLQFVHRVGTGYDSVETIIGMINRLVETGFKVARLYPPNISLLQPSILHSTHASKMKEFHAEIEAVSVYYNLGLETQERYSSIYNNHVSDLLKYYKTELVDTLEVDNGYRLLMLSGARGNADNLRQTFGIKGSVQKNDNETFDAIIENAYARGLTPLEHAVDAFGGRQGQIDKSLKTGDTGYAMRKMWHTTQGLHITCEDCGTNEGFEISKKALRVFSTEEEDEAQKKDVQAILKHAIVGRYDMQGRFISKARAKQLAEDDNVESVTIRSPLFCHKPCCQKCYGVDWSTNKLAVIGLPIGVIAAQSIGEPGTQLTLKQFQKGGVAGANALTSAFDKVDSYLHIQNIAQKSAAGTYSGYDPIAWATGKVNVAASNKQGVSVLTIGKDRKSIRVPSTFAHKEYAEMGEGLSATHGDYDMNELLAYSGFDYARFYLVFKLFSLYRSEIEIKMCHFETIVANMTRYMVVGTSRPDLRVGQYCTPSELWAGPVDLSTGDYLPRLVSLKSAPHCSHAALDALDMEYQSKGLARVTALQLTDPLNKPINNIVVGKTITDGSAYPNFIEDRKELI